MKITYRQGAPLIPAGFKRVTEGKLQKGDLLAWGAKVEGDNWSPTVATGFTLPIKSDVVVIRKAS